MLQEVAKNIKSVMNESFIKRLSQYLHDCVREEVKSSTFRNLKGDKDNKWKFLQGEEIAFSSYDTPVLLDGSDPYLTELMIQSEMDSKDKYLIYGYLFLVGKNGRAKKNNEFLTPLLYAPCKLERAGVNISLNIQEEMLSLNTGAIAQLMKKEEEEVDAMLSGLLDAVPDLPITKESLDIFITTLKSLVNDVEIIQGESASEDFYKTNAEAEEISEEESDFDVLEEISKAKKIIVDKISLEFKQAVILTKRPNVTAGVLYELTQIGEKGLGIIRENALNVINQEYLLSKGKIKENAKEKAKLKDFFPITPLSLSDSQEEVIRKIEENDFLAVYGPPGTGKSQTIVNLVAHLIATGKTVLVASRMDKAIDVVAQRLNELNAPYLALRAGRANYQKQLNFKLQDLLSNKVDLDNDFEDAVLVDTVDMKNLLTDIKNLENRAEEIIKLEEEYIKTEALYEETAKNIGEALFVKEKLDSEKIEEIKRLISLLQVKRRGFLKKISDIKNKKMLLNILQIKNLDESDFSRILFELEGTSLAARLVDIEDGIYKIGNMQQILNKIKELKGKQKNLAVEILRNKRRTALKDLLNDQKKRQRLIVHSKSLVLKRSILQSRVLEKEDFRPLLDTFPCWCTTTYAISNSLPLKSGLFDVVIIDEASQCDIASCFPLLYRAKKAVVVGDDKQLPHLSFLEKAKEQSFLNQYNIEDKYQLMWRFRVNSMFDLANYYSAAPTLLDEHFRSEKPIIQFSSNEFYGGRIRIMKPYLSSDDGEKTLELIVVPDGKVDMDATRNTIEAEALMQKLQDITAENKNASIGIISPFRAQVELIKRDVMRQFSQSTIQKHQIEVGTAHTFQGDERDIMLISWTYAHNSHSQSLMFLQKPNLFNVAITRARKMTINFISTPINDLPKGLLRDYLEYVSLQKNVSHKNEFKNDFEKELFDALSREFPCPINVGVDCGGVNMDILINKTVIECDGAEDLVKSRVRNMKKQSIIERSGYKVVRVSLREWKMSPQAVLERIKANV